MSNRRRLDRGLRLIEKLLYLLGFLNRANVRTHCPSIIPPLIGRGYPARTRAHLVIQARLRIKRELHNFRMFYCKSQVASKAPSRWEKSNSATGTNQP